MRTIIYFLIVIALIGFGIFNLNSNNGAPSQLPKFINKLVVSEDPILPVEQWDSIMIGTWDFKTHFGSEQIEGQVTYNPDNTFIRTVFYKYDVGEYDDKAVGTIKGSWKRDSTSWVETSTYCKVRPEGVKRVCEIFEGDITYGEYETDTWERSIVYFNNSRIEIRVRDMVNNTTDTFKFTKAKD